MRMIPLQRLMFTVRDDVWNPCFISCDYLVLKIIALLVIIHQEHQSTHTLALVLFTEHQWHLPCTNVFVVEMLCNNFINQWTRNWGNFSWISSRVKCLFVLMCWSILVFKSSVMRDRLPDWLSSWTFGLPSLNIRHHFLAFHSFVTPSPYTAISWQ
jgi:hypothetical protein